MNVSVVGCAKSSNIFQDAYFFRTMLEPENIGHLNFKTDSLFDPESAENRCVLLENEVLDREKHLEAHGETFALQKYGAFYLDYLYTADENEDESGEQGIFKKKFL